MKSVVILGAGTAGTSMANKLARRLDEHWHITLVDQDEVHVYQPGLLFLPFGGYRIEEIVRRRRRFVPPRAHLEVSRIESVDPVRREARLANGRSLFYDVLIVATGADLAPEQTEGLTSVGWRESAHDFYSLEGATALRDRLDGFRGGRLVVNVVEMPIKCPVAPLEFVFLADAFFAQRKLRERVEIVYATPLDAAFTKPRAAAAFGDVLERRHIALETSFAASRVDGQRRVLHAHDGRELGYDLLVTVPLHIGARALASSGLADAMGFVKTDAHTLQTKTYPNVFALGDATDLPVSKAGSVAHFQSEVLIENVLRFIEGAELAPDYDGHTNCFIETGYGKGMLIDFNYETEPLPGKYPLPGIGPFDLLRESHVNHWGKLAFKGVYWDILLRGKELPLDHRMLMAGKWS